ncbi:MAG: HD-GYP domain-containing protein [Betaproteobacteria bacterium]|nr:HD-GYP domain-containing protein [Betaproteobacteria bacterium]
MRKKININELKTGMYIDELCGSWMDHPFWKATFKLEDPNDLVSLHHSSIKEVWIDTVKGLDVGPQVPHLVEEDTGSNTYQSLEHAATVAPKIQLGVSLEQELARAEQIRNEGRHAIMSMFAEVRMGKALPMDEMVGLVDKINDSVMRNHSALLSLVKLKNKDDYTYLHSVAVCALMIALGKQLGVEENQLKLLGMAGLLHDVGKIAMPEDILNKPGRLTDDEFELIKTHPVRGWEILKESPSMNALVQDVCLHHHERVDGTGYPDQLSGPALTLAARMGGICDVYDAITSDRCYKAGWPPAEAIRKMAEWQNGHFDATIFQAFVRTIGIYPVGTLLKLKSGRLAVVTDQSEKSLLKPVVKVFFSTRSNTRIKMELVDLSHAQDTIENIEHADKWGLDVKKITGVV